MATVVPDDGGWISGSMTQPRDRRPEYSPASLVLDVLAVLARAGIRQNPGPGQEYRATLAAVDLLEALGVRPTTAPHRP